MQAGVDCIGVCVIFVCHDDAGRFAMLKRARTARDEHECWDFGGGAVELHASIEETLRREIHEEYRTNLLAHEFLGYRDVHRMHEGAPTHWIALDFSALVDRSLVQIGEPTTFSEFGWFDLDHLPTPLHSTIPEILRRYRNRLLAPKPRGLFPNALPSREERGSRRNR